METKKLFSFSRWVDAVSLVFLTTVLSAMLFTSCSFFRSVEISSISIDEKSTLRPVQFNKSFFDYTIWTYGESAIVTPDIDANTKIYYRINDASEWTHVEGGGIEVNNLVIGTPKKLEIKVLSAEESEGSAVYTFLINRYPDSVNFNYAASAQNWTAPIAGTYIFELWGAEGGTTSQNAAGGKGGYLKAEKSFAQNETIYLYTGEKGKTNSGSSGGAAVFGGGGKGGDGYGSYSGGASGGGATFVSTASNNSGISDSNVRNGRLLVAGGGGGGTHISIRGGYGSGTDVAGNGLKYGASEYISGANTPSVGNSNGIGTAGRRATETTNNGSQGGGGGGGGYYGGISKAETGEYSNAAGGGGNGFVNTEFWTAIDRKAGNEGMPSTTGDATETGHSGNGYIRVSFKLPE